jgi:hypothetical protein
MVTDVYGRAADSPCSSQPGEPFFRTLAYLDDRHTVVAGERGHEIKGDADRVHDGLALMVTAAIWIVHHLLLINRDFMIVGVVFPNTSPSR